MSLANELSKLRKREIEHEAWKTGHLERKRR